MNIYKGLNFFSRGTAALKTQKTSKVIPYKGLYKSLKRRLEAVIMLKVLLIEDSDTDAYIIQRAIQDHIPGAVVTRASTLSDGKKVLLQQDGDMDIILLDLGLPDTASPVDTHRQLKRWADKMPIIVITAINDHNLAKFLVFDGVEDYLSKNAIANNPAQVRDAIDFAIQRFEAYKKLLAEKEKAQQESKDKDAILGCFMGDYSVTRTVAPESDKTEKNQ
jgi:DNA-binding NarL/FixJ family response regulator